MDKSSAFNSPTQLIANKGSQVTEHDKIMVPYTEWLKKTSKCNLFEHFQIVIFIIHHNSEKETLK